MADDDSEEDISSKWNSVKLFLYSELIIISISLSCYHDSLDSSFEWILRHSWLRGYTQSQLIRININSYQDEKEKASIFYNKSQSSIKNFFKWLLKKHHNMKINILTNQYSEYFD
jgi:hypothetical protein